MATGYPSIDKIWLKYYKKDAFENAKKHVIGDTVWDVMEPRLKMFPEIPALEYMGNSLSRMEFIDLVYTWAKALKVLGVSENEVISICSPFVPDICAIVFAINIIGACSYFVRPDLSLESLEEETRESRVAIVLGDMWEEVEPEFLKDRFKTVLIANFKDYAGDGLDDDPEQRKVDQLIDGKKYFSLSMAKRMADNFKGVLKADHLENRNAFITSSSGTTEKGMAKGVIATNESAIAQIRINIASELFFQKGERCLNHFPPMAATSLCMLFFLPLYHGETVVVDPRLKPGDFYDQLIDLKPNFVLHTGSAWELFFRRVSKEIECGKEFNFKYAKAWIIGGEGTDKKRLDEWNEILMQNGAEHGLITGYGLSEVFSSLIFQNDKAQYLGLKDVVSVGIPQAGVNVGVFDQDGNELSYGQRGELWTQSESIMKEYYKKEKLTAKTMHESWLRTGDLAEIDEDGQVYIYGRIIDSVSLSNGDTIFLFDLANRIKKEEGIDNALVLNRNSEKEHNGLLIHLVFKETLSADEKKNLCSRLDSIISNRTNKEFDITFFEHQVQLPYSPITYKIDRDKMMRMNDDAAIAYIKK